MEAEAPRELTDPGLRERLFSLAGSASIALDPTQLDLLVNYLLLLQRWNRTINLTALPLVDFPERSLLRLVLEPLQVARLIGKVPLRCLDVGSGGGSPAIPIKIRRPGLQLTMVESRARKAAFLTEAVRTLSLATTEVLTARIEALDRPNYLSNIDLVTVRGVKIGEEFWRAASRLLRPGGRVILLGSRQQTAPAEFVRSEQSLQMDAGDVLVFTRR